MAFHHYNFTSTIPIENMSVCFTLFSDILIKERTMNIHCFGTGTCQTKKGNDEKRKAQERVMRNILSYWEMAERLTRAASDLSQKGGKKQIILNFAKRNNLHLDRLAARRWECLVCWFCENPSALHLLVETLTPRENERQLWDQDQSQFDIWDELYDAGTELPV
jgi:hypothetical protein